MAVFEERRDDLERYEFMMGVPRGRLAVSLDLLTDALTLVGQHAVYCQKRRAPDRPALDVELVMQYVADAKELIGSVIDELKKQREAERKAAP